MLQLNIHALTYVALHEVIWCVVVWCSQNVPRWQQIHVAKPYKPCTYTTLVDIQKMCYKKLVTHVEAHASAVSLLQGTEQHYMKAINNNSLRTHSDAYNHSQSHMWKHTSNTQCSRS